MLGGSSAWEALSFFFAYLRPSLATLWLLVPCCAEPFFIAFIIPWSGVVSMDSCLLVYWFSPLPECGLPREGPLSSSPTLMLGRVPSGTGMKEISILQLCNKKINEYIFKSDHLCVDTSSFKWSTGTLMLISSQRIVKEATPTKVQLIASVGKQVGKLKSSHPLFGWVSKMAQLLWGAAWFLKRLYLDLP